VIEVRHFVIPVLIMVLMLSVAAFFLFGGRPGASPAELFFPNSSIRYFSVYGNGLINTTAADFMLLNTSTMIPVVALNNTLYSSSNTLSGLVLPGRVLTQTLEFPAAPIFNSTGLVNKPSLLLSDAHNGRASIGQLTVYVNDSKWTLYTNGTRYYVTNGTYSEYFFIYANESTIRQIPSSRLAIGGLIQENDKSFPAQFSDYLSNVTFGLHVAFSSDSVWWYSGYARGTFSNQNALPGGYRIWS